MQRCERTGSPGYSEALLKVEHFALYNMYINFLCRYKSTQEDPDTHAD